MQKREKSGLTVLELLFALVVLGVAISAALPVFSGFWEGGQASLCKRNRAQLLNEYRNVQLLRPGEEVKLWKLLYTDAYAGEGNVKGLDCPAKGRYYLGGEGGIRCTEHDGPDTSGAALLPLLIGHSWSDVERGISASTAAPPRYTFQRAHHYYDASGDFVCLGAGGYITQIEADYYGSFRALMLGKLQSALAAVNTQDILTEAYAGGETLTTPVQRGTLYAYDNALYVWRGPAGFYNPPTDPKAPGAGSNWLKLVEAPPQPEE